MGTVRASSEAEGRGRRRARAGVHDRCDGKDTDSDDDGLDDGRELDHGTNPLNWDSDFDKLSDGDEIDTHETDPLNRDTDGDGLRDDWEILGYDSDSNGTRDIDLAGMGTSARKKDILVEVDWMFLDVNGDGDTLDPGEISFQPFPAAITTIVNSFANSRSRTPTARPGST